MKRRASVVRCTLPVLAAPLLLVGCGSGDSDAARPAETSASAAPSGTKGGGTSGADDGRTVVALDDFAATAALTLGVRPDLVLEVFDYASTGAIFDAEGVTTEDQGAGVDVERVAAARPDVVLATSLPTTVAVQERLETIAPTTVLPYTAPWEEQLRAAGEALGRTEQAEAVVAALARETSRLADDLATAGLEGTTVSVVGEQENPFALPETGSVGGQLSALGLARPSAQRVPVEPTVPFVLFSQERLEDHDADQVFLLSGPSYPADGLTGSPVWGALSAVADGDAHEVSGEVWLAPTAFSASWVLDDLRAVLLDGGSPGETSDAPERFAAFVEGDRG